MSQRNPIFKILGGINKNTNILIIDLLSYSVFQERNLRNYFIIYRKFEMI